MRLDTKAKRIAARDAEIAFMVKTKNATVQHVYDLIIVKFDMLVGKKQIKRPVLKVYKGTSYRPIAYYSYTDELRRDVAIGCCVEAAESRVSKKAKAQREKKSFKHTLKAGDILYTSWGYDQTNVDFFQVISAKGCFVMVGQIAKGIVAGTSGFMCGDVTAKKDAFIDDKPLRRKVCDGNTLRISQCETAWLWDGKPKYTSHYA